MRRQSEGKSGRVILNRAGLITAAAFAVKCSNSSALPIKILNVTVSDNSVAGWFSEKCERTGLRSPSLNNAFNSEIITNAPNKFSSLCKRSPKSQTFSEAPCDFVCNFRTAESKAVSGAYEVNSY
jgi:hypothetical protein